MPSRRVDMLLTLRMVAIGVVAIAVLYAVSLAIAAPASAGPHRPNTFAPRESHVGARSSASTVRAWRAHARDVRGASDVDDAVRAHAKQRIGVWVVPWDRELGLASLEQNADLIGEISPFWFELRPGAGLRVASGAFDAEVLRLARRNQMRVLPTISNSFERDRVSFMLRRDTTRLAHVRRLVGLVVSRGYDGLDVDYENVAPRDRAGFSRFVQELGRALHARGKLLSITVMAKTSDARTGGTTDSMDYRAIGAAADQVRIMAYDYHWSCGAPGPIAPADWVDDVVAYAVTRIDRRKVVLGVPFYGYDWPRAGCATARIWSEVPGIQARGGGALRFNVTWQTFVYSYKRRQFWYEEQRSLQAKALVAQKYDIRGVFAWRLGGEDPALWGRMAPLLGRHVVVEHPAGA